MTNYSKTHRLAASVSLILGCAAAQAQTNSGADQSDGVGKIEEITVTANRREESLSDVPLSIVAMDQAMLDAKGVKGIDDISRLTPGITFAPSFQGSTNISIRGVSSRFGAPTTGIYLDDTPIQARPTGSGTSTNFYPSVFDLERVEVLRGPQGTLFGAGSVGGTIRFITPKPGLDKYSGYSRAEVGFTEGGDPSYEIGSAIGGPIVEDRIGFRLSGYHRTDGGWIDQIPGGGAPEPGHKNSNEANEHALRGAMTFRVTDDFQITPSIFYQKREFDDLDMYFRQASDPDSGRFVRRGPLQEPGDDQVQLYSLNMEYDLHGAVLVSSTSYMDRLQTIDSDYTGFYTNVFYGNYDLLLPTNNRLQSKSRNVQRGFTQEIRLQSDSPGAALQWVVGAFYQDGALHSRAKSVASPNGAQVYTAIFGVPPRSPVLPGEVIGAQDNGSEDSQYAAFGQIDYKVLPDVTLTLGARYAVTETTSTDAFDGPATNPAYTEVSQEDEPFTPRFGIKYEPSDSVMLYASAAQGFRLGGGNIPPNGRVISRCTAEVAALSDRTRTYDSDSIWNYEIGAKGRIGRMFSFDASAYQIDWKDIQNLVTLGCGWSFVANLGDARNQGFDATLTVQPLDGLSIEGTVSYNDAKFTRDGVIQGTTFVRKGDSLMVPPISYAAAVDYQFPVGNVEGYIHLDYQHQDGYRVPVALTGFSLDLLNPRREATDFASARVGARFSGLDLSLFVDNLTNSRNILSTMRDATYANFVRDTTYRPRTYGMTASYKF